MSVGRRFHLLCHVCLVSDLSGERFLEQFAGHIARKRDGKPCFTLGKAQQPLIMLDNVKSWD